MAQRVKFKTIRLSDKGQIAIPVEIQCEMGIRKGDELLLIKKGEKVILEKPKKFALTLEDEFEDLERISEISLKSRQGKTDDVWNSYLKSKKK